ncbi:MAG: SDR family oxidoreductase [Acidimicrobiales bacterium]|nr:SDR family oxidoreductase [Acidimicrobiales bacterium]
MAGLGLVTGGARGIGRGIAEALVADGVVSRVVVLDLDPDEVPGAEVYACDVTDEDAVRACVDDLGVVPRVLVNNAGGGRVDPSRTDVVPFDPFGPVDLWRDQIDLNLTAAHVVTRVVGPRLEPGAAICNTASIAGLVPNQLFAYAAAKAGLIHWTRCLALALAPRRIRANAVAPGFIYTRLWQQLLPDKSMFDAMVGGAVPMGTEQTPAEIAATVSFLCSDRAGQVTGQVVAIDGGSALGRAVGS